MTAVDVQAMAEGAVVRFHIPGGGEVTVDARAHDLLLQVAGGRTLRVAASRAGFADAVLTVEEVCGDRLHRETVQGHLRQALFAAARARGVDVAPAYAAVNAVLATALPCCRGIVENPHLLNDIVRFRAAAAAVAYIEDGTLRDRNVPEQTDAWAHRLRDWRSLYRASGSVARSVNRTLALYSDDVAPELLWGLRRVVINAPLPSIQHVEVLGGLASVSDNDHATATPIDPALQAIVMRASAHQLGEALVLVDEADASLFNTDVAALRLAEVLTSVPLAQLQDARRRRISFRDLFEQALHELREVLRIDAETIAPPIPPPSSPGIRFLDNVGAILREGVAMQHCVATRAPRALAGESYLFHIDHGGARATAEVSHAGVVLEVRGPENTTNVAVRYAQNELRSWGARLALRSVGDPSTSLWTEPGPPLPAGSEPVRTVAELEAAVAALTTPFEPGDEAVWSWAARCAIDATVARRWLVVTRAAGFTWMLSSLDARGAIGGNALVIREAARAAVRVEAGFDDERTGRP
jgi:hypothetical protein